MNREQINNLINTCQQEIRRLQEENKQLKEQLEASEKARKDAIEFINGVFEMSLYTKSKSLDEEGIEEILDILDIDKGE